MASFAGLVGDDDDRDSVRLYLDLELNTFLSIGRDDVLHRERMKNSAGVEVSVLFVRSDATVHARQVSSKSVQADALSDALAAAESGTFPSAGGPQPTGGSGMMTLRCAVQGPMTALCGELPPPPVPKSKGLYCAGKR